MKYITLIFLVLVLGLSACSSPGEPRPTLESTAVETTATEPATVAPSPAAEAPFLEVVRPDGAVVNFSKAELQALPQGTISVNGSDESGTIVLALLSSIGITMFTEITFDGQGSITLTFAQVTRETILDFTNRGTVKFADTSVPKSQWPHDITRIIVK